MVMVSGMGWSVLLVLGTFSFWSIFLNFRFFSLLLVQQVWQLSVCRANRRRLLRAQDLRIRLPVGLAHFRCIALPLADPHRRLADYTDSGNCPCRKGEQVNNREANENADHKLVTKLNIRLYFLALFIWHFVLPKSKHTIVLPFVLTNTMPYLYDIL